VTVILSMMVAAMKTSSFESVFLALAFAGACTAMTSNLNMNKDDNLTGTWTCVSATIDGKELPKETAALLRLTLTQDRYKTEKGPDVLFDSSYRVDTSQTPRHISMIGTEGDLKGKEAQGIYSIDNDILRICYTMPGGNRPEKFESAAGSKAYLVIWKREPKKD